MQNQLVVDFTSLAESIVQDDRRVAVRHRFRLIPGGHLAFEGNFRMQIWPDNLSTTGIGFYANWPLDVGVPLEVHLATRAGNAIQFQARVVHATRQTGKGWLIGCSFEQPLEEAVLESIMG